MTNHQTTPSGSGWKRPLAVIIGLIAVIALLAGAWMTFSPGGSSTLFGQGSGEGSGAEIEAQEEDPDRITVAAPEPEEEFTAEDEDTYEGPEAEELISTGVCDEYEKPDIEMHADQVDRLGEAPIDASYDGAGICIPELNIFSPLIATDTNGVELILPEPPSTTWYERTVPVGSDEGRSLLASHVNFGHGSAAPFSQLHKIEKGTPIIVRDFEGEDHAYRATEITVYDQQALPDELFSSEGDHELVLVTCSGPTVERGDEAYFLYNLVVIAEPIEE